MRLNTNHREALRRFMRERIIGAANLVRERDAAYTKASKSVLAAFSKKFPPEEIAVLKKYDLIDDDPCVKIRLPGEASQVEEFVFAAGTAPPIPVCMNCRQSSRVFDFGDAVGHLVEKWRAAENALIADRDERVEAYTALIFGASTDTEILKVWPEAAEVFGRFNDNLPAQLTNTMLDRIKADLKDRKVAA